MTRIGIVGTREPTVAQVARVDAIVLVSPLDATIVSGGATGIDTAAREAAIRHGRAWVDHLATKYSPPMPYVAALFKRNGDIVADSTEVHALPGDGGGTYDSIRKALTAKKPLVTYDRAGKPMGKWLIRVEAPHFVAGVRVEHGLVIEAAPILYWSKMKPARRLVSDMRAKGYDVSWSEAA